MRGHPHGFASLEDCETMIMIGGHHSPAARVFIVTSWGRRVAGEGGKGKGL